MITNKAITSIRVMNMMKMTRLTSVVALILLVALTSVTPVLAQPSITVSPYAPRFVLAGDEALGSVYYYPSNDDGTFGSRSFIGDFDSADGLGIADFDNDGDYDFVVGCGANNTIYLYTNDGAGTFTRSTVATITTYGYFSSLRAGDFNNDGLMDFVGGGAGATDDMNVSINNGDGTFTLLALDRSWSAFSIWGLDVGDFDSDGNLDIIMVDIYGDAASGKIRLYLGNGDGTFTDLQVADLEADAGAGEPWGLAAGDFNSDGAMDIVVGGDGTYAADGGAFWLYTGDGAGSLTFQGKVFDVDDGYTSTPQGAVDAYDFDRDGDLDIVAVNWSGNTLFFIEGNGDGTFQPNTEVDTDLNQVLGVAAPYEEVAGPVGGEILAINGLQLLAPLILILTAAISVTGIALKKKRQ